MHTEKIGWIGLGNMGTPMAKNLLKAGYTVTVYNRTPQKENELKEAGAGTADSPQALMNNSDTVFIMVSDDAAVRELFTGNTGLLAAGAGGKTIVNMSTVSPGISREMAALCSAQGNHYLDAPVAGSVKPAQDAQLVIMAGGEQPVFDRVKPLLHCLGKSATLVGSTGAGNNAKLAINVLLGFNIQGLSEALLFAQRNGIATEAILGLINESAVGNLTTKTKANNILQHNYQAAFPLKHLAKDINLARAEGLHTPLATVLQQSVEQAAQQLPEEDIIALYKYLSSQPA